MPVVSEVLPVQHLLVVHPLVVVTTGRLRVKRRLVLKGTLLLCSLLLHYCHRRNITRTNKQKKPFTTKLYDVNSTNETETSSRPEFCVLPTRSDWGIMSTLCSVRGDRDINFVTSRKDERGVFGSLSPSSLCSCPPSHYFVFSLLFDSIYLVSLYLRTTTLRSIQCRI